jgi:hypothetical protein
MRTQSSDTTPEAEQMLIHLIRKAPITKRFELVNSLTSFATKLNKQNIRTQHPDATNQQVAEYFARDHYDQTLANGLHSALQEKEMYLSDTSNIVDTITPIATVLEQLDVNYCITGTIANSIYGMQRAAFDVDFTANLSLENIPFFLSLLPSSYYFDEVSIKDAIVQQTFFEGLHFSTMLKVHVSPRSVDSFMKKLYQRVQFYALVKEGKIFRIASPEDTILTQLVAYKASVTDDCWNEILSVLKVQKEVLDIAYLQQWATPLNVRSLLERAFEDAGIV